MSKPNSFVAYAVWIPEPGAYLQHGSKARKSGVSGPRLYMSLAAATRAKGKRCPTGEVVVVLIQPMPQTTEAVVNADAS